MWIWLASLPPILQFIIALLSIISAVIISIKGTAALQWGKTKIGLGGNPKKISTNPKKRSCADCIFIILSKREILGDKRLEIRNSILKDQMNFAEQKLIEIKTDLLQEYRRELTNRRNNNLDLNKEDRDYKVYKGALIESLGLVKDEVRKSFKENGFEELSGNQFSNYVKDKVISLLSIATIYVDNEYPHNMIISREDWLDFIKNSYAHKAEDICFEVFQKAKDVKKRSKDELEKLNRSFSQDISEFMGSKKI